MHSKNWISLLLDPICTERTSAPAFIEIHDVRVVGTAVMALASHLRAPTLLPLRTVVQNVAGYVAHFVVKFVYPGCAVRLEP